MILTLMSESLEFNASSEILGPYIGNGRLTGLYINTRTQTLHEQKTYNATYSEIYIYRNVQ